MTVTADSTARAEVTALALAADGPEAWPSYFAHHAKTFRLASRLFPAREAARVAGVYAFCRFTDDLVDEPHDGAPAHRVLLRLKSWSALARSAFDGEVTGIPLLDEVIGEARESGVSWRYPDALLRGVAMDLERSRYPDWKVLHEYTFGVAGSVGGWLTQLMGLKDEGLLERAHALGHGMQLTNIVRDVGEDWRRGRVYLPESLLFAEGLEAADIGHLLDRGGPVPPSYARVLEAVLQVADEHYETAEPGIRELPAFFRRPVSAAAAAYHGIHREVRKNRYDNLTKRAHTSLSAKVMLAGVGVLRAGVFR